MTKQGVWCAGMCLAMIGAVGCGGKMAPNARSGIDQDVDGAEALELTDGEGSVVDSVSYGGGDRVDWKAIELPAKESGRLALELRWKSGRNGADLSFIVYDEANKKLAEARPRPHSHKISKALEVADAHGTIYVKVYASERKDAGDYALHATFTAVAPPPPPCDPTRWSAADPACKDVCPIPADLTVKACQNKCTVPPDANIPACQPVMACPLVPDRRVLACAGKFPPCSNANPKDPANPNCDSFKRRVTGKVISVARDGSLSTITINRGADEMVDRGWIGHFLVGGKPVKDSPFTITSVTRHQSLAKVSLSADAINQHLEVELVEP